MKTNSRDINDQARPGRPASKEQLCAIERLEKMGFGLLSVYGWRTDRVLEDARVAAGYIEAMCTVAELSFKMEEKA